MILAFTDAETVGGVVALFIAAVAIITLVRIALGREAPWRHLRIGLFVERQRFDQKKKDLSDEDTQERLDWSHREE